MSEKLLALVVALGCGCGAARPVERAGEQDEEPPRVAVALRLVEAGPGESEQPRTRALLVRIRRDQKRTESTDLGAFAGACSVEEGEGAVVLRARCWWGPSSSRIEVVRDDDMLIARSRPDDGSSWRELARVELPEQAELDPVGPGARPVR